jgi:hypothetical protein
MYHVVVRIMGLRSRGRDDSGARIAIRALISPANVIYAGLQGTTCPAGLRLQMGNIS